MIYFYPLCISAWVYECGGGRPYSGGAAKVVERVEKRVLEGLGPCYHMQVVQSLYSPYSPLLSLLSVLSVLSLLSLLLSCLLSRPLLSFLCYPCLSPPLPSCLPQYRDGDRRVSRTTTKGRRRVPRRRVLLDQCDVQPHLPLQQQLCRTGADRGDE